MRVEHDPEADAVYVYLTDRTDELVAETRELDDARWLDYTADGTLLGVELLYVSGGVLLDGLPEAERIADALRRLRIPILSAQESSA